MTFLPFPTLAANRSPAFTPAGTSTTNSPIFSCFSQNFFLKKFIRSFRLSCSLVHYPCHIQLLLHCWVLPRYIVFVFDESSTHSHLPLLATACIQALHTNTTTEHDQHGASFFWGQTKTWKQDFKERRIDSNRLHCHQLNTHTNHILMMKSFTSSSMHIKCLLLLLAAFTTVRAIDTFREHVLHSEGKFHTFDGDVTGHAKDTDIVHSESLASFVENFGHTHPIFLSIAEEVAKSRADELLTRFPKAEGADRSRLWRLGLQTMSIENGEAHSQCASR